MLACLLGDDTRFGNVALLDIHSFPSCTVPDRRPLSEQIYLGDNGGRANPGWLTGAAQHAFTHAGLTVSRNVPVHGGYIVGHYGGLPRVSALYVGARWDLYLDEQHPDRTPTHADFRAFKNVLSDVFTNLVGQVNAGAMRMNSPERLGPRLAI